ncbi:hypothetical protein KOAAANKH_00089 [Brevundimonas sp. NIBR10]|uniref:hypothetical protein n=1 Tax=Brevundimonas sp. NIBR10 TaxID=3015997 RepID=UPI0022F15971|nr:hypothetical protein [Brevundimonas sp. NIBR10]WGM45228.1 hypothetical protein KOAAANKH_00089 [Brevundimonas sp. NIBR10]
MIVLNFPRELWNAVVAYQVWEVSVDNRVLGYVRCEDVFAGMTGASRWMAFRTLRGAAIAEPFADRQAAIDALVAAAA